MPAFLSRWGRACDSAVTDACADVRALRLDAHKDYLTVPLTSAVVN